MIPRGSFGGCASSWSLDFDPVMLRHHEGAEERLGEIAKALPAQGGARELDAETADGGSPDGLTAALR